MPRSYVHLSLEDRRKIARWRDAKMPVLEIAARLGRHRATIHRELRRKVVSEDVVDFVAALAV